MDDSLKAELIPALRQSGFKGTLPHFRRLRSTRIDLLTFQFDKWGGGFLMEIAHCGCEGTTTYWGEHVPPSRVRAWDLHPDQRIRIKPGTGSGTDSWFRFDSGNYVDVARQALRELDRAHEYWNSGA